MTFVQILLEILVLAMFFGGFLLAMFGWLSAFFGTATKAISMRDGIWVMVMSMIVGFILMWGGLTLEKYI
jgi:hypothetical protein